ncbi:NfeD family protein [Candidatus Hodarchaeum mangrovi]
MSSELQEFAISGIILGLILTFIGSFLNLSPLYDLGLIIFGISISILILLWLIGGGGVEVINWLPIILIISITLILGGDFVSQSSETQIFTWPLIIIIFIIISGFFTSQGGDLSIIVPFIPVLLGLFLIGLVGGEILWQDPLRGIAYGFGSISVFFILIWTRIRKTQQIPPIVGEASDIIGKFGKVTSTIEPDKIGNVKIAGAIWKARSKVLIEESETIEVINILQEQLILEVVPAYKK